MGDAQAKYQEYVVTSMVTRVEPLTVVRGRGALLYDDRGTEYIDGFAGISVVNAGHCDPDVGAAAKQQIDRLVHCCSYVYHVGVVGDLAEKLAHITPGRLKKTFFANSGAEANEGAMRIAKQYTGRDEFVALQGSFHGRTVGTLSISGNSARKAGGGPYLPGVAFAPTPYCYRCPFGATYPTCGLRCAEELRNVIRFSTSGDVAAFIAEPVLGEGGIIVPPPEYFSVARRILDEQHILFVADEVQTGFGRTGAMFGIEHYGVEPDIVTMAKGIANGFPLGAFTVTEEVARAFKPGDHLSTFGGNPVSCAAGLASIRVLEERRLPQEAARKGAMVLQRLEELKGQHPIVGDVRGKGLMIGIELVSDARKTPAPDVAARFRDLCREQGLLVGLGGVYGNVVRLQPPLVIDDDLLDRAVTLIERALAQVGSAYHDG